MQGCKVEGVQVTTEYEVQGASHKRCRVEEVQGMMVAGCSM